MDPCPFVRVIVESLALKLPVPVTRSAGSGVHPTTSSTCFCTLELLLLDSPNYNSSTSNNHCQTVPLPLSGLPTSDPNLLTDHVAATVPSSSSSPVVFSLDPAKLRRLSGRPAGVLAVSVYVGRRGSSACGLTTSSGRLVGKLRVPVDLESSVSRAMVMQSGWVSLQGQGGSGRRSSRTKLSSSSSGSSSRLHIVVRSEPDPRFVFEFGGEAECSPVVYQVDRRSLRQPVFSCRFTADRRRRNTCRSRSLPPSIDSSTFKGWLASLQQGNERDQLRKVEQRKGWTVTIHDLSGSPVAAASMVTPFVPSPGSDRVSRSNPGAWLILRATGLSTSNWKPWARLEAWRERGSSGPVDGLGYKLELVMENGTTVATTTTTGGGGGVLIIAESSLSVRKGGQFRIDPLSTAIGDIVVSKSSTAWPFVGGSFVMESTVEGEGKVSKPTVQVGVQHVSCMGDVALFIALSAAIDLSMDACQLFSRKLRKELCQDQQEYTL
ncbi:uncharacterized protein M6B38_138100 [Iris pallida]|uniref:Uncharacterized protein n=1 Tax=Iris pallida TaxID=29817 RepID=A0AAX6FEJ2_IRIPA|nr:uncharacterized protein M6B38_138100 [Iris pallida]